MKLYKGQDLKDALVTYKIDGVNLVVSDGVKLSRAGKPLHNLPDLPNGTYEVFLGDWSKSVSACRTHNGTPIQLHAIYKLTPEVDTRLVVGTYDITGDKADTLLTAALEKGYEGLVFHGDEMLKLKPVLTFDLRVTGLLPGRGRNTGKLGAFTTSAGNVGTGLTDIDRVHLNNVELIGTIIEVEAMGLTPGGKLRHPRFKRLRFDKDEADLEGNQTFFNFF